MVILFKIYPMNRILVQYWTLEIFDKQYFQSQYGQGGISLEIFPMQDQYLTNVGILFEAYPMNRIL